MFHMCGPPKHGNSYRPSYFSQNSRQDSAAHISPTDALDYREAEYHKATIALRHQASDTGSGRNSRTDEYHDFQLLETNLDGLMSRTVRTCDPGSQL
jgi:hypothetical protein